MSPSRRWCSSCRDYHPAEGLSLIWIATPGVGKAATLPDSRTAFVEPCRTKPGLYRLRIVTKPGQAIADFYSHPAVEPWRVPEDRRGHGRAVDRTDAEGCR